MKAAQAPWKSHWFIHLKLAAFSITSLASCCTVVTSWAGVLSCSKFLWAPWASWRSWKPAVSTSWKSQKCLARSELSGNRCVDHCTLPAAPGWATRRVLQQRSAGTRSLGGCSRMVTNCSSPERGMWTGAQWCRFLLQALWNVPVQGHEKNGLGWKGPLKVLLWAGISFARPGCSEPCPTWPWMFPGMGYLPSPWETCSSVSPPSL